MKLAKDVDRYIENAPEEARSTLNELRAAVREAAPDSVETISYGMPFYSFKGESGFQARLCYFGLLKSAKAIAFYTRPVYLEKYMPEVEEYMTTKSALQFPLDRPIPVGLVKKLVENGIAKHEAGVGSSLGKERSVRRHYS